MRLAKVLATNTTITSLILNETDLIWLDNVVEWGDALMENKTLTFLNYNPLSYGDCMKDWSLHRVEDEIKEKLRTKTKGRTPSLHISH